MTYRSLSDYAKNAPDEYADAFGEPDTDNHGPTDADVAEMLAGQPSHTADVLACLDTLAARLGALAGAHADLTPDATSPRGGYNRGRGDGLRFAADELRRALSELRR